MPDILKKIEKAKGLNLKTLDLMGNELTSLPAEIGQLVNLETLRLNFNNLMALPAEIGQLTNLKTLNLDYNKLTVLPTEIGQLANLKTLRLDSNNLMILPAEIGQLDNLETLRLGFNNLMTLPAKIGQLPNLETLNLENNHLCSLPVKLGQLTNLTELNLVKNKLTYLPVEMMLLKRLDKLDLSNNQLPHIPLDVTNKDAQAILKYYFSRYCIGGEYLIESLLGKGAFGEVYKIRHNGKLRALKKIKWPGKDAFMIKFIDQEIRTLRKLSDHDNSLKFYEAKRNKTANSNSMLIITAYANNGNLLEYIQKNRKLEEFEALDILFQITRIIKYAHDFEPPIIHRDIKPENILCDQNSNGLTWYLCDWGIAKEKDSPYTISMDGSVPYIAPEVFYGGLRHKKADIYALGMTFFYMLFGYHPFRDIKSKWAYIGAHIKDPLSIPADCSPEIKNLILKMVEKKPKKRFGADNVIETVEKLLKDEYDYKRFAIFPKWKFWA